MVSMIVAVGDNNVIGLNNKLLWHLPEDLKFFKRVTIGHPVIMGRKTFDSLGKPLSGRVNVVVTRQQDYLMDVVEVVHSLPEALKVAQVVTDDEVFIIGGGDIYREAMEFANTIYLTRVYGNFDGDTFFPSVDNRLWKVAEQEDHDADDKNIYPYSFIKYERIK